MQERAHLFDVGDVHIQARVQRGGDEGVVEAAVRFDERLGEAAVVAAHLVEPREGQRRELRAFGVAERGLGGFFAQRQRIPPGRGLDCVAECAVAAGAGGRRRARARGRAATQRFCARVSDGVR